VWFGLPAGLVAIAALDVERFLDVGYWGFGLFLSAGVAAGIAGNVVGGPLAERRGTRAGLTASLLAWSVLMLGAAVAGQRAIFAALFICSYATGGLLDVMINVSATAELGSQPGRLARFHALWNSGALAGAIVVATLLANGISWRWALAGFALLALPLAFWVSRSDLPAAGRGESHPPLAALAFLWRDRILPIAIALLAAAVVEGGVDTWGVLFLRAQLALGVLAGAGAFFIGQSLAVGSRTFLGPVAARLRPAVAAAAGAALAAAGLLLEANAPAAVPAAVGLALGISGIALCWPLLMAAGSRGSARPGLAVGGLTTAAYGGFLLGPAIVGSVAGTYGLRASLWLLAAVALIPAATLLLRRPRSRTGSP
jgi:predicted MFS family arabinose efflux permease